MRVLIWGAGTHGKTVADVIVACGHDIVGFVDADESLVGTEVGKSGARVLYTEDEFLETLDEEPDFDAVALAMTDNTARLRSFFELAGAVAVPAFVHPSAVVSPSATIGDGSIVGAGVVINASAEVGRVVILETASVVEHDNVVGDGARVGCGAILAGTVTLGERALVSAGATVIPNLRVGADATVEPGSTVVHEVADGARVEGTPARPL